MTSEKRIFPQFKLREVQLKEASDYPLWFDYIEGVGAIYDLEKYFKNENEIVTIA